MRNSGKLIGRVVLAASLMVPAASKAQDVSAPEANRITLNILAFDSHGQPVGDPNPEDFQITDQGKPQRIVGFRRNSEGPQLGASPADKLASGASHVIVILYDLLNVTRAYDVEEIARSFEHLESGASVYLCLLTNAGNLYPIQPMPEDNFDPRTRQIGDLLKRAVEKFSGFRPLDTKIRVEATIDAIDTLGAKMAQVSGRKYMILVTPGVPTIFPRLDDPHQWADYSSELHQEATRLDRYGITVSSVDRDDTPGSIDKRALEEFADLTGGKVYKSNLEGVAISYAITESQLNYILQNTAPPKEYKYKKIQFNCIKK
jgi:VWFA-related protein